MVIESWLIYNVLNLEAENNVTRQNSALVVSSDAASYRNE